MHKNILKSIAAYLVVAGILSVCGCNAKEEAPDVAAPSAPSQSASPATPSSNATPIPHSIGKNDH
ncbi:MAG: hypothetical protein EON58_20285 [Alphaproteobacteria bacterium]|nr:MAG: hypothetical protein EON58_20285 [Alphaproteobacteria bacterium]